MLGTSALLGVGIVVDPALAEEPIRISIGGYYKAAYMVIDDDNGVLDDDDDDNPQLGHNTNRDGLFSDAEIHFLGSTVLDNGLEVGVQIELEGEDQFDDRSTRPMSGSAAASASCASAPTTRRCTRPA